MTSNPALIRAATAALLVVLFHPSAARADPIVGTIDIGGAEPVIDGPGTTMAGGQEVPLTEAGNIWSLDVLSSFSGDLINANFDPTGRKPLISTGGAIPAGEEYVTSGFIPFTFYPDTDFLWVDGGDFGNSLADPDTFFWYNPLDPADTYTFIIDPLSWTGTTASTGPGVLSTLSYSAVGIVEATTDTPGLTYDPTWATLTVTAELTGGIDGMGGGVGAIFTATGVAVNAAPAVPEAGSTAILFAMVGAGLFAASRRRSALRSQALA